MIRISCNRLNESLDKPILDLLRKWELQAKKYDYKNLKNEYRRINKSFWLNDEKWKLLEPSIIVYINVEKKSPIWSVAMERNKVWLILMNHHMLENNKRVDGERGKLQNDSNILQSLRQKWANEFNKYHELKK